MEMARYFLEHFAAREGKPSEQFTARTEQLLESFTWPGNGRQLENVIQNIIVLHSGKLIAPEMLPPELHPYNYSSAPPSMMDVNGSMRPHGAEPQSENLDEAELAIEPLHAIEKRHIEHAIKACGGSIPKAAARLGISASTVYRKKQAWLA